MHYIRLMLGMLGERVCPSPFEAFHNTNTHSFSDFNQFSEIVKNNCTKWNSTVFIYKVPSYTKETYAHLEMKKHKILEIVRENVIDSAVCSVRDCFDESMGSQCDENGTKTTAYFSRRKDTPKKYFACVNVAYSVKHMLKSRDIIAKTQKDAFESLELLSFQYPNPEGKTRSIDAWVRALQFLGYKNVMKKSVAMSIDQMYTEGMWTNRTESSHNSTIYNMNVFTNAIMEEQRLVPYLRLS